MLHLSENATGYQIGPGGHSLTGWPNVYDFPNNSFFSILWIKYHRSPEFSPYPIIHALLEQIPTIRTPRDKMRNEISI